MSTEPTSSQEEPEEKDLAEDLDVDEEAAKNVAGGLGRAGDPCDGGEVM